MPGYPDYLAASDGRIKSFRQIKSGLVLKPYLGDKGYYVVTVYSDNRRQTRPVHALIASAFHGERPDGAEVRHLNGSYLDNRAENLAWGSSSRNNLDQVSHGTHAEAARTHCDQGHEWTTANTGWRSGGKHRRCKECHRRNIARYRQRKREGLV